MDKKLLFLLLTFITLSVSAQEQLWGKLAAKKQTTISGKNLSSVYDSYRLDIDRLRSALLNVPKRNTNNKSKVIVSFPNASGNLVEYAISEASLMHPDLAAKFPNSKSYIGQAINNKGTSIRFSLNSLGLYAMIFSVGKSTVYIDPLTNDMKTYALYQRKDLKITKAFECLVEEQSSNQKATVNFKNANDLQLRTFELALATTEEYSDFHIAGIPANSTRNDSIARVLDAINVTLTRVNALFERDVALTMQLVPNNDQLIFLSSDPGDDPYTNSSGSAMLSQNQTTIDNIIGPSNYDIGHVFSTGGGGVAFLGSPCSNSRAGGVTGLPNPVGDPFDVDFVAHEFGHQFGANHTFNGTAGNCAGANRNGPTAVEPGSGTTIMAYAGICTPQNVQLNSDDYFHIISIQEMFNFISSGNSTCDDETNFATNMNAPTANAGSDFTVPVATPLVLKGQGSDADGDELTYIWEQIDNETNGISIPPSSTQTGGAVFRSLAPDDETPNRYLPDLATVVAGDLASTWEVLPSVGRTMNFAFTVRDNVVGEGQTNSDDVIITVDENSGPFRLTSQDAKDVFWAIGASQTITWDVANTNVAPVNSPNVNILLSLDGGFTYPITLATNTPNDGSHEITVPNNLTTTARVKVEGANHIFYALNESNISIVNDFALSINQDAQTVCIPDNAVYDFVIDFAAGFNASVDFTANNVPAGATATFNPTSATSNSNIQLTISGISGVPPGQYAIEVVGSGGGVSRNLDLSLDVFDPVIKEPVLTNPADGATGVLAIGTDFTWQEEINVQDYAIEIATDAAFNTIIESANTSLNSYTAQNLQDATTYYWRLRPSNPCATGNFSAIRTFTTSEIVCNQYSANDLPLNIPDNNAAGINSITSVVDDFIVSDVNVTINVTHTWMQDLIFTLESPLGTRVELVNRQCTGATNNQNMAATFDDLGVDLTCVNASPVIAGTIKPAEDLASFNGEFSLGDWTLTVSDNAALDTGSITSWSLELCESVAVASTSEEFFQDLAVWPNPTNDTVNISFLSSDIAKTDIKIYDMIGKKVLHKSYTNDSILFSEQLNVSDLATGTYIVKISKGNANTTKRLLIF